MATKLGQVLDMGGSSRPLDGVDLDWCISAGRLPLNGGSEDIDD